MNKISQTLEQKIQRNDADEYQVLIYPHHSEFPETLEGAELVMRKLDTLKPIGEYCLAQGISYKFTFRHDAVAATMKPVQIYSILNESYVEQVEDAAVPRV